MYLFTGHLVGTKYKVGFAVARRGLLWGLVDVKGSIVIPFNYTSISHVDGEGNRLLNGNEQINEKDKIFDR